MVWPYSRYPLWHGRPARATPAPPAGGRIATAQTEQRLEEFAPSIEPSNRSKAPSQGSGVALLPMVWLLG